MSRTAQTSGPRNTYKLSHELDGSSYAVRENLVDILERELLGPIDGPEEELPLSPKSLYLVGHIAPVKLSSKPSDFDVEVEDDSERGRPD